MATVASESAVDGMAKDVEVLKASCKHLLTMCCCDHETCVFDSCKELQNLIFGEKESIGR